MNIEQFNANSD